MGTVAEIRVVKISLPPFLGKIYFAKLELENKSSLFPFETSLLWTSIEVEFYTYFIGSQSLNDSQV